MRLDIEIALQTAIHWTCIQSYFPPTHLSKGTTSQAKSVTSLTQPQSNLNFVSSLQERPPTPSGRGDGPRRNGHQQRRSPQPIQIRPGRRQKKRQREEKRRSGEEMRHLMGIPRTPSKAAEVGPSQLHLSDYECWAVNNHIIPPSVFCPHCTLDKTLCPTPNPIQQQRRQFFLPSLRGAATIPSQVPPRDFVCPKRR